MIKLSKKLLERKHILTEFLKGKKIHLLTEDQNDHREYKGSIRRKVELFIK